jgi:hypothetical protein
MTDRAGTGTAGWTCLGCGKAVEVGFGSLSVERAEPQQWATSPDSVRFSFSVSTENPFPKTVSEGGLLG